MSQKNPADFREVHTHDAAHRLIRDFVEKEGGEVLSHRYESTKPDGKVLVGYQDATHCIRYGLPDDRDELRRLAIAALEPPTEWKSQHERDW